MMHTTTSTMRACVDGSAVVCLLRIVSQARRQVLVMLSGVVLARRTDTNNQTECEQVE